MSARSVRVLKEILATTAGRRRIRFTNATHLVHDRDPLYTAAFRKLLDGADIKTVRIPAKSPNCNPHAERFVRSIKHECLHQFVFLGERHLRYVISEYMRHYQHERFHQGLDGSSLWRNS